MRRRDLWDLPRAWRLLPGCATRRAPAGRARAPTLWRPAHPSPGELPSPAAPLPAYPPATAEVRNTRPPHMPMSTSTKPPSTLVQRTGIFSEESYDLTTGFYC